MIPKEVEEFAKGEGFAGAEFLEKWHGYDVYRPIRNGEDDDGRPLIIGYPYVILVNGKEIRMSTYKETLAYMGSPLSEVV